MNRTLLHLALGFILIAPVSSFAQERDGAREKDRQTRPERGERGERGDLPQRGDRERGPRGERADKGERPEHANRDGKLVQRLPKERVSEALDTLKQMFGDNPPNWLKQLENAAEEKPEMVAYRLGRFPRMLELMETRKDRPAEFKLHVEQAGLMREIMRTNRERMQAVSLGDEAKANALRAKLREHMKQMFEARLQMKRFEIERQRNKLKKAEEELAQLEAESDRLIDEKLAEMEKAKYRPRPNGEGPHRRERDGERGEREHKGPRDQPRDSDKADKDQ